VELKVVGERNADARVRASELMFSPRPRDLFDMSHQTPCLADTVVK